MANIFSRSLHDVGLAAWFGGTLANAVALNPAAGESDSPEAAAEVTTAGWNRWTPVNAVAIGAHLIGGVGQLQANKGRLFGQKGVGTMTIVKLAVTGAALGVTAYSRVLGKRIADQGAVAVKDGTTPASKTPPEVAAAQKQLTALQWVIPALTGALVVISSVAGEQQRPGSVIGGLAQRIAG